MVGLDEIKVYEEIGTIKVTKERFPIHYNNKIKQLLEEGICKTQIDAEKIVNDSDFTFLLCYGEGYGIFAIERFDYDSNRFEYHPIIKIIHSRKRIKCSELSNN